MVHALGSVARRLRRVIPLPNLRLRLQPPRGPDAASAHANGVDEVVFVTTPDVTKLEVRAYLERALGIGVADVRTANYEGKKKRDRGGFHKRADYKKVYVTLRERWFPPEGFIAKEGDAAGVGGGAAPANPMNDGTGQA